MASLSTTDNNLGKSLADLHCPLEAAAEVYKDLSSIANTSVKDFAKNNSSLLVFPEILGSFDDGIEEQHVFDLCGNPDELKSVKLTTGNLMGFIGIGGTLLKISSRFSQDDENDFFLHYMLEKVFSINLFDFKYTTNTGGLDLLMFLFPHFLKKALAQGLFRQYQTFKRNDANVKGAVDVNRHIKLNVPFDGKIAYNSRERTFDNPITQLIRHTVEFIKTKNFGNAVLNSDSEMRKCVQEIIAATPSYSLQSREKIIAANLKPVNHPYFTKYKPLQKLCLAILRHKKIGFGNSNSKVYGILFDGAWLWEEYLATVLKNAGFAHPKNKSSTGAISVYSGNPRYPDFYKGRQIKNNATEEDISENFVLDAKYKHLDNHKSGSDEITGFFSRDDLHQLITYMYIMPTKRAALIYPYDKDDRRNGEKIIPSADRTIFGYGGTVCTYGVPIPVKEEYSDFVDSMRNTEKEILNTDWFSTS